MRFALVLLITMMSTYFNRDEALEEYLEKYNDHFPQHNELEDRLTKVFEFVDEAQFPPRSRAWKRADLLTLLVEVDRALNLEGKHLQPSEHGKALQDFYEAVDKYAKSGETDFHPVVPYHRASLQATNDRGNRLARAESLRAALTR